jgi:hypothetical protein
MKNLRRPLVTASLVAVVAMLAPVTIASAAAPVDMKIDGDHVAVYATSYISTGANATINGDAVAGLYLTTGANSNVSGGVSAGGATTLGALATAASVCSAGATTLGAGAEGGNVYSGGATTMGAGAIAAAVESGGAYTGPVITQESVVCTPPPEQAGADFTGFLQTMINDTPSTNTDSSGNSFPAEEIASSVSADETFTAGVYKVNGMLTIASGVTITLDAGNEPGAEFIFNIDSYLAVGADVNVVVVNNNNARVIWNVGGYATVGAGANVSGTIMADAYVTMGVESSVTGSRTADASGSGFTCDAGGAVYSLTSYVGIGAGATVGSTGGLTAAERAC